MSHPREVTPEMVEAGMTIAAPLGGFCGERVSRDCSRNMPGCPCRRDVRRIIEAALRAQVFPEPTDG